MIRSPLPRWPYILLWFSAHSTSVASASPLFFRVAWNMPALRGLAGYSFRLEHSVFRCLHGWPSHLAQVLFMSHLLNETYPDHPFKNCIIRFATLSAFPINSSYNHLTYYIFYLFVIFLSLLEYKHHESKDFDSFIHQNIPNSWNRNSA